MPTASRSAALVRHNLGLAVHEPGPAISRLVMPVGLVLVLRPLYLSAYADRQTATRQAVVGLLVMFSLLALSVIGNALLAERTWRTLDRLRATPATPVEILLGKAVPALALVLLQQAVVLGLGAAALGLRVRAPGLLVLACLAWATTLLCLGGALGVLLRSHAALAAATDVAGLVLTCLGGALLPVAQLPGWARAVAPGSPGYWAMRALSGGVQGDASRTLPACAVLLALAAAGAAAAAGGLARGGGRRVPG